MSDLIADRTKTDFVSFYDGDELHGHKIRRAQTIRYKSPKYVVSTIIFTLGYDFSRSMITSSYSMIIHQAKKNRIDVTKLIVNLNLKDSYKFVFKIKMG